MFCQNVQNIILYYSLWWKKKLPNNGKIRWPLRNDIFLPKISFKKGCKSVSFCSILIILFLPSLVLWVLSSKFIALIARNTLETKKDTWLWFSRLLIWLIIFYFSPVLLKTPSGTAHCSGYPCFIFLSRPLVIWFFLLCIEHSLVLVSLVYITLWKYYLLFVSFV